jgi:hypothetical protein
MSADPSERASVLLQTLARSAPEQIKLGVVAAALEDRGFGIAILCLALPNAVPGPYLPGVSMVFGLPIIWLGLQMARGRTTPGLPGWLERRSVGRRRFTRLVAHAAPLLTRIERWLMPRPGWLTRAPGQRLAGMALIVYGLVLSLPIPLGNLPVAVAITVLALGMIERDNRALISGLVIGMLACLWNAGLVGFGVAAAHRLLPYVR